MSGACSGTEGADSVGGGDDVDDRAGGGTGAEGGTDKEGVRCVSSVAAALSAADDAFSLPFFSELTGG